MMWFVFRAADPARASLFQSGWFVESLLTQTLIIHVIRTNRVPFLEPCALVADSNEPPHHGGRGVPAAFALRFIPGLLCFAAALLAPPGDHAHSVYGPHAGRQIVASPQAMDLGPRRDPMAGVGDGRGGVLGHCVGDQSGHISLRFTSQWPLGTHIRRTLHTSSGGAIGCEPCTPYSVPPRSNTSIARTQRKSGAPNSE